MSAAARTPEPTSNAASTARHAHHPTMRALLSPPFLGAICRRTFRAFVLLSLIISLGHGNVAAFPRQMIESVPCEQEFCPPAPLPDLTVSVSLIPEYAQFERSAESLKLPEYCESFARGDFNGNGTDEVICPLPRTDTPASPPTEDGTDQGFVTFELHGDGTTRSQRYPFAKDVAIAPIDWRLRSVGNPDADRFADLAVGIAGETTRLYVLFGGKREVVSMPIVNGHLLSRIKFLRLIDTRCDEAAVMLGTLGYSTENRSYGLFQQMLDRKANYVGGGPIYDYDSSTVFAEEIPGGCSVEVGAGAPTISALRSFVHPPRGYNFIPPEPADWRFIGVGDFVGSGYPQFLFYAGPALAWWVVSLQSAAQLLRPITGLPRVLAMDSAVTLGDFDGDGRTDLLITERGGRSLYRSKRGTPLPDIPVVLSDGRSGTTGADGTAHFSPGIAKGGKVSISAPVPDSRVLTRNEVRYGRSSFVFTECHLRAARAKEKGASRAHAGCYPLDGPPVPGPYVCVGMARSSLVEDDFQACPVGHYILGIDDATVEVAGTIPQLSCCPLPDREMLLQTNVPRVGRCEPNEIVTGLKLTSGANAITLRCTKLDPARAQLGPPTTGHYFGPRSPHDKIAVDTAPVALQDAIGRMDLRRYDVDGCVGQPWGAVLTAVEGKRCDSRLFAEIKDPSGVPIRMFPDCNALSSHGDPRAGCR